MARGCYNLIVSTNDTAQWSTIASLSNHMFAGREMRYGSEFQQSRAGDCGQFHATGYRSPGLLVHHQRHAGAEYVLFQNHGDWNGSGRYRTICARQCDNYRYALIAVAVRSCRRAQDVHPTCCRPKSKRVGAVGYSFASRFFASSTIGSRAFCPFTARKLR